VLTDLQYDGFDPYVLRRKAYQHLSMKEIIRVVTAYSLVGNNARKLTKKVKKAREDIVELLKKDSDGYFKLSRFGVAFSSMVREIRKTGVTNGLVFRRCEGADIWKQDLCFNGAIGSEEDYKTFVKNFDILIHPKEEKRSTEPVLERWRAITHAGFANDVFNSFSWNNRNGLDDVISVFIVERSVYALNSISPIIAEMKDFDFDRDSVCKNLRSQISNTILMELDSRLLISRFENMPSIPRLKSLVGLEFEDEDSMQLRNVDLTTLAQCSFFSTKKLGKGTTTLVSGEKSLMLNFRTNLFEIFDNSVLTEEDLEYRFQNYDFGLMAVSVAMGWLAMDENNVEVDANLGFKTLKDNVDFAIYVAKPQLIIKEDLRGFSLICESIFGKPVQDVYGMMAYKLLVEGGIEDCHFHFYDHQGNSVYFGDEKLPSIFDYAGANNMTEFVVNYDAIIKYVDQGSERDTVFSRSAKRSTAVDTATDRKDDDDYETFASSKKSLFGTSRKRSPPASLGKIEITEVLDSDNESDE
jgi:hypothetical protein